ncbi:MAG: phospho-sugar mutase [Flavobacteriales bacterium]|nr:phospho-sugar mutase [Flavobacteriales bacterium]
MDEQEVRSRAQLWLTDHFDEHTRNEVQRMLDHDANELKESFYTDLEFGTGGLRGIMGVGTNRVNVYTIGLASLGLAKYVRKNGNQTSPSLAIAHDSRNNSPLFARKAAEIFASQGIKVYLFSALRPTPELSFAVRHLKCDGGVVITASHNPKEYNGYKVYWNDGAQVIPPHDKGIIEEVRQARIEDLDFNSNHELIQLIDKEVDEPYLHAVMNQQLAPEVVKEQHDLKIVYTALHGTGITLIPEVLSRMGFTQVRCVPQQDIPDGNFPTVDSPNPEEREALSRGLEMCREWDADLLLGTDPDTDRVGLAVKNHKGDFVLLNGNQAGSLLVFYHLIKWHEQGRLNGKQFIAKTIVTTELIRRISSDFGTKTYDTLTGFKYIAGLIADLEGKEEFITGGEESYGYLIGDFVRDKDAVCSAALFCEMAAWARSKGQTLFDVLMHIYKSFGHFQEDLVSITKKGISGKEEIAAMMTRLRSETPRELDGSPVILARDYQKGEERNLVTGHVTPIELPASNVLQFETANGSVVTARPSGTEPKIKFYFSVREPITEQFEYDASLEKLTGRIQRLKEVWSS